MEDTMSKQASLVGLALVVGLTVSGCCTPEKCFKKHGLIECTLEECQEKHGKGPPDGPDIVLGPGLGNSLVWTIGGSPATDGGSLFDDDPPGSYCRLRKDFIGTTTQYFKYTRLGQTTPQLALEMVVKSGDIELRFKEGSSGAMDWWIADTANNKSCTLRTGEIPATFTDLPSEFLGFTTGQTGDSFREVEDGQDAKQAEIKVEF
jgi:hypothetical protein